MVRVCVIGAGPSGTAQLRAFQSAASKGVTIPEIVCYEKQEDLGGLWNYSWRTGLDAKGEPVHNSMYRYLWSNGPKEALEFADYSFEEHFGRVIPSFPPREVLFDYIKGRVEKANVRHWIRFNTVVRHVSFDERSQKFSVTADNVATQSASCEEFDFVVCATGHFSTPNVPFFEGFSKFEGRILHAHDFRDAVEMAGKDILVIGTSYSAEDIASQCYKYGVKTVTLSYRTAPMGFHWPDNFSTVPLLTKCVGKTCHFKDGSSRQIDAIILCTGYQHHFPFMEEPLRLRTPNRLVPDNLDLGMFWKPNPKLMYLGMMDQWYTFNMFDAQAWYARDYILGKLTLPSRVQLDTAFARWRAEEDQLDTDESKIVFQGNYVQQLMDATDYPHLDIDKVNQAFFEWEHNKHENIMTFRDCSHTSALTGNKSTTHHTPWMEAKDDSMACYLQSKL